jgi:RNA polymerase sigma-70 factor (ECF subfamily)
VENKERAETIARHLERLKPKYKEILYLYYYKELSRDEVARKLGITPRRVSERVNYAQKLLKKMMKK